MVYPDSKPHKCIVFISSHIDIVYFLACLMLLACYICVPTESVNRASKAEVSERIRNQKDKNSFRSPRSHKSGKEDLV